MNNPYHASEPVPDPDSEAVIEAELVAVADPISMVVNKPRIWTVVVILLVVIVFYLQMNIVSLVVAQLAVLGDVKAPEEDLLLQLMQSRLGFCLMLIPSQLAIAIPPLLAAIASPTPVRQRLGLVRGHWPLWAWIAGGVATPLVGLITTLVLSPFIESSEHLTQMTDAIRGQANGGFLIGTLILVGGLPAICEELLFRGYIQTRLVKRMPAMVAVLIASVLFAAFHLDPVHVMAVLPIGLWLGFLRHASGSILPAMLAHAINNLLSVISVMPEQADPLAAPSALLSLGLLGFGIPCLLAAVVAGFRYPAREAIAKQQA